MFDYPKDFVKDLEVTARYAYSPSISDISRLLQEYVEREKEYLFEPFENDKWGFTKILLACDRRVGKRRLDLLREENEVVGKIVEMRIKKEA